jgi:protein phosphatase
VLKIYSKSDIGLVRKLNEDACRSGVFDDGSAWAVVCDGMGGANGGDVASGIAVEKIAAGIIAVCRAGMGDGEIKSAVTGAITRANAAVREKAKDDASLTGMGTTVVVAVVGSGKAHIAHAGDSRAYLLSPGSGIRQLTTDHSMVQEMVDKGDITKQQARIHPQKNIITRALGAEPSIRIDYLDIPFSQDDRLLICTDGLSNYLDDEQINAEAQKLDGDGLTAKLVAMAKEAGGGDNITVTLIEN